MPVNQNKHNAVFGFFLQRLANFWRTSHLLLAVFSSVFLLIASISGIILSTAPVAEHFSSPSDKLATDTTRLSDIVPQLKEDYIEVFSLSVDQEKAVQVDVIGFDENPDGAFYIHPSTGEKLADLPPKNEVYTWVTTLHRSLFLHNTGRIFMGITVFLLLLITLSGMALVIKRTNGFRNIFAHIKKQNSAQFYHTILGRIAFVPIVIMAFSGSVLFLNTQFKPQGNREINLEVSKKNENLELQDFPIFQNTYLSEVKTLNFPFSSDEEDYFELELQDRAIKINQFTGSIIAEQKATWIENLTTLSITLHTGRGQWIWAIVLGLISLNLLYFMYSGTKIAWRRLSSKSRNKVNPEDAEFIILTGSENGSTRKFGQLLFLALVNSGKSVYITDMNHYQSFPKAKHLVIMASTYGDGDPPFNARHFLSKVEEIEQRNTLKTHVIGFGSMIYPQFCQFAIDVYDSLDKKLGFELKAPPTLIDGRSQTSFSLSIEEWKKQHALSFELPNEAPKKTEHLLPFEINQKQVVDDGFGLTFTLEVTPKERINFQSGDLLAIAPPGDDVARYYSIGKTEEGNILLSIKKHDVGECSNFLFNQEVGGEFMAYLKVNSKFHLPKKGDVLMIANGTGIAPFLGMSSLFSKQKKTFYLGGRNPLSFKLYHKFIQHNKSTELFNKLHFALSKEEGNQRYVQDLVIENRSEVVRLLKSKGNIMICGSIKMRDGVLDALKLILKEEGLPPLEKYIEKGKVLMDCY
ncbi:PepSY domain-containing protein [Brumimicrobium oceani]|uniref:NADPH--hemoprotein reductase n=1 Tax=Brumimicrobium oceani TaxID=2100725 RepID=A0A2U2XG31_9FLAO|nr:PepSY domain-containing protein [Brumimicrobium oceani]PWH86723.1 FAD-binding oxidoreductase [Brumimicrobium oceani]